MISKFQDEKQIRGSSVFYYSDPCLLSFGFGISITTICERQP
jgi:hypothetical protein